MPAVREKKQSKPPHFLIALILRRQRRPGQQQDTSGFPVFLTHDPDGVSVCLSKAVWTDHILLRHPEVDPFKGLIVSTIADPDSRQMDPEDDRVLLYYGIVPEDHRPFHKALFLRVVVKYVYPPEQQGRRTGLISAVYFVDRMKKGAETI